MATLLKREPATNVSQTERWISLAAGASLMAWGIARRDKPGLGIAGLGAALTWRGFSGHCDMYHALGINTAEREHGKGTGSYKGVPYELGIRVDQAVRINKPAAELYRFWRNLENLPRFMQHLDRVRQCEDGTSHWVVKGPAGFRVEWDAEIVNEIENRLIGWRSLPGSNVDNGGSVHFDEAGDNQTIVRVELQYNPPAGSVGNAISKALGEDPREMIRQDLQRFRQLMETGSVQASSHKEHRTDSGMKPKRQTDRDTVQSASEESFPASDAPSWTPVVL